jgi:hypothetical protein
MSMRNQEVSFGPPLWWQTNFKERKRKRKRKKQWTIREGVLA